MADNALADTGALLALLDSSDSWHERCVAAYRKLRLPLATSHAVLTELFYLAATDRRSLEKTWEFVRSGALIVLEIAQSEIADLHALMSRYSDRPMDYADATLVYLARREGLSTVFTVDHADFETYRIEGRKQFRIVPSRRN
jgi:predicted nucleic acid-binding protein